MTDVPFKYKHGVTLIGGGPVTDRVLSLCLSLAPTLVAADGGADQASALGRTPDLIIGDLDSLVNYQTWRESGIQIIECVEQETTDFEKCLYTIEAPFILGCGFIGGRLDHELAAISAVIARSGRPVILLGETDLCLACPPDLSLDLPRDTRLSLMPLRPVRGTSTGLAWPITGIAFAPGGKTGTSNRVIGPVRLRFDTTGMLLILPVDHLQPALTALTGA